MATIEQLRSIFGGGSDAVTIQRASQKLGIPIEDIASEVGFDTGGKWGNRASASIDSAQASLLGVGEALTGSATLRNMREANNAEANAARQIARSKGAIMDSSQVEGFGTGLEFIGGLAVDTAPQLAATGLAGLAAGPWGAGAVGYTFALGDILENQREQAGTTDLRSAALLAVPYAAVDTFTGIGGAVTRRALPKAGLNLLDKTLDGVQGIKGAALRTGVNVGKTSVIEGAGETFQEGMNQLGRMAVDPNETFLNDRSMEAFKESFIGGAALGGAVGGATGGWRRSEGYKPPIDETGGVNLLTGEGLQLGYNPNAGQTRLITFPDGTTAFPEDVPEKRAQVAAVQHPGFIERPADPVPELLAPMPDAAQIALEEDKAKIEARNAVREEAKGLGITGSKGTDLYLELKQALEDGVISEADFRETRVQLGERKNNQVAKFIKAAYAQADAARTAGAQTETDAIAAVQNTTPEARSISDQEADAMVAERGAALAEQAAPAAAPAQAGPKVKAALARIESALAEGYIDEQEAATARAYMRSGRASAAKEVSDGIQSRIDEANIALGKKAAPAATPKNDVWAPARSAWDAALAEIEKLPQQVRAQLPTPPAFDSLRPDQQLAVTDAAKEGPLTLASIDPILAMPAPRGRQAAKAKGRVTALTANSATAEKSPGQMLVEQLIADGKQVTETSRQRVFLKLGMDKDGWPATSARTDDQVAAIENARARKKAGKGKTPALVGRSAINTTLSELGITDEVVSRFGSLSYGQNTASDLEPGQAVANDNVAEGEELREVSGADTATRGLTEEKVGYENGSFGSMEGDFDEKPDQLEKGVSTAGFKVVSSPNSSVQEDDAGNRAERILTAVKALARGFVKNDPETDQAWYEGQPSYLVRSRLSPLAAMQLRSTDGREQIIKAAERVMKSLRAVLSGLDKNSPEYAKLDQEIKVLDLAFGSTRAINAGVEVQAAVAEQEEIDSGLTAEMRERNERIIAANAVRDNAALVDAMNAEIDEAEELAALLKGIDPYYINEAPNDWEETRKDSDGADPAWGELSVREKAQFVRLARSYDQGEVELGVFLRAYNNIVESVNARNAKQVSGDAAAGPAQGSGREGGRDGGNDVARGADRAGEDTPGRGVEAASAQPVGGQVAELPAEDGGQAGVPAAAPAENSSVEDQRVAQDNAAKAKVVVKKKRTIQKPVDLEDPAVATAEIVEAKPVAQARDTTPGTVGATVAGQPVSAKVGPGFTANDVVKGGPKAESAIEPVAAPDWAVGHARDTGGEVVFHNDEVALVSGFSVLSGKHVYSGVLRSNGSRTRVDISSYTGNMFTPEQLATLRSERERVVADEQAKMAANPDGPFAQGDNVASTSSVPVEAANYLRGLLNTLNMKGVRVFLLVPDDVRGSRDENKLYGDYAAAGSAGLDANEDGSMRRFGPNPGDFYISMRPGMSAERVVETIAHEVGHIVERTAYDKADAGTKAGIRKEYEAWLAETKRMTAPEIIQALRNRATAEAHSANVDEDNLLSPYWTSFSEWFADNVSRWATTSEKPVSLVDKFFSAVAATIRKLAASVTGRTYVPNPVMAKFLDGMVEGTVGTVPWSNDTTASQSASPAGTVAQQLGPQYAKAETALTRAIGDLKTAAIKYGAFTRDLIDQAAKLMPAARTYLEHYEAVATDRTRMEQQVDAILERFATLSTHERTRVNEVIRTSTMSKEWAFKPDWLKNAKYDENSDVARAFRALTPTQRGVIQDVFRHGHDTLAAMQKAVEDNVNSEFDVLIKGFRDAGNMDEAAKAEARKAKALTEFSSMLEMNGNWPYAPLRRFGDHVVVAKSAAYRAAEKAKDAAAIKKLEADENHYYVEFFESRGDARKKVADMQATGKYDQVENFNKGNASEQLYGGRDMFNAFRRLRGLVNETEGASLSEPANATINKLMNDLYLSLLGERSARQAERNRKNTAGADRDMMRAFATKGRADAHFIASLRFGGQVQEDLLQMKREADEGPNGGTRELRREYFNEILARHTMQMDFQSTPVVDKVMATSSFWQLLFNPAYYLQNVMQPWVMSLPMLAGKHGYGKSWSALARAYRDLGPLIKDGAFTKGDYDALPADVRAIVKDLAARGRIEITLEHDLGQWNSNVDDKVYNRAFTWVTKGLRSVNSRLEMLNRLATGIAAARLEGVGNAKNATDYADRVIIGTHGDYNAFNAPRLMRTPLGRMATQFRKFQLIQITMYTKLISDALKGASPDERAVARRVLAYNLGHMAALGGAMGLPGFQLFSMVLGSIFGDDDEPDDAEATLRRTLGNGPLTDALTRGVPNMLGVDLSGKVGSGNMLSLFPYADWDIESRSGYQNLLAAAAGPFVGGLMPKWADAVGTAKQGDYYKALEKVLPGALGNAIKGTRFAVDGVTTTRGVQAMSADEITWVDGLFQAVGLPTSTITDRNFRSSAEYKASKFFDEKASQVKKDYIEAFQDNDTDAMAEARQEWLDMQATRRRLGMTVQPLSQLIKAPQERRKRERAAVGGVATDRETQGFVRQFTE